MIIGLRGFSFDHENKGCEALTYTFLSILKRVLKDSEVKIINISSIKSMGEIPCHFSEFEFSVESIELKDPKLSFLKVFSKCDYIFDIYDGDGFSDIYFTNAVFKNTILTCLAEMCNTTYVMLPQTYGPFKHKSLELLAGYAIKHANYVFARDRLSENYARKIARRKEIDTVTDLAFALPYEKNTYTDGKIHFGINVSGLLWKGGFSEDNQFGLTVDYKKYCIRLIEICIKRGYIIHLIPHVTCTSDPNYESFDGDIRACQELGTFSEGIYIAPNFKTPMDAKSYISGMNYFVGARMHATIAAISSGVNTISFAYSRKFEGLYKNLNYPYVVDGCKLNTEESLKKTVDYIDDTNITNHRIEAMREISDKMREFELSLINILNFKS